MYLLTELLPDVLIVPYSQGDLLWGIWEEFREAREWKVENIPRLFAVEPFVAVAGLLSLALVFAGMVGGIIGGFYTDRLGQKMDGIL